MKNGETNSINFVPVFQILWFMRYGPPLRDVTLDESFPDFGIFSTDLRRRKFDLSL